MSGDKERGVSAGLDLAGNDGEALSRWVLAQGLVGWVSDEEAAGARRIEERVLELEARAGALELELEAARQEGLEAGLQQGRALVEQALAALRDEQAKVQDRALRFVMAAVEELAGRALAQDPAPLVEQIRLALRDELEAPERIRLSPAVLLATRELWGETPVVADETLGPGDAVIETTRGKRELLLASVLSAWAAPARSWLEGGGDDG